MTALDGFTYVTCKGKGVRTLPESRNVFWESKNRVPSGPQGQHMSRVRFTHTIWTFSRFSWICRHHLQNVLCAQLLPLSINDVQACISRLLHRPRPLQISDQSLDSSQTPEENIPYLSVLNFAACWKHDIIKLWWNLSGLAKTRKRDLLLWRKHTLLRLLPA